MTREEKVAVFRKLHERAGAFVIPNPWDAGSAKILTALGFEALATTSAGYAFTVGRRDSDPETTREDILGNAKAIVEASHLPVSADMQNGFGHEPEACAQTILRACEVGLAGGSIEDATGDENRPIYDSQLAVKRVAAAARAAHEHNFVLTARAENFLHGRPDLEDTIHRLQAFAEAGADVVYAPGITDVDAIRKICASVAKPVNVLMGLQGATHAVPELESAGAKRISVGGSLVRVAYGALLRAAREMKEQGTFSYSADAIPSAEMARYMANRR